MKTIDECRVWTIERADGSWICSIESPTVSHISVLGNEALTEEEAIENCKVKWHEEFNGEN